MSCSTSCLLGNRSGYLEVEIAQPVAPIIPWPGIGSEVRIAATAVTRLYRCRATRADRRSWPRPKVPPRSSSSWSPRFLLSIFGTMELARIVGLRSELQDAATAAVRAAVARGVSGSAELRAVAEERLWLGRPSAIRAFSVDIDTPGAGVDRVRVTIRYVAETLVPLLGLPPIELEVQAAGYRDS